jgi:cytochrome c7-like protein
MNQAKIPMNQAALWKALRLAVPVVLAASLTVLACVSGSLGGPGEWWSGHGPVIAHENFPGECTLCHTTENWQTLKENFTYDHEAETGFALVGAHEQAQCLRCHNDRGPVQMFASQGCGGCHQDVHQGRLGAECESCHEQTNWSPTGQIAEHARTRFPLIGAHAAITCDRCHPGIGSGIFEVLNTECVSCHQATLARATEPDHMAQGWVQNCEECHLPTIWKGAGFRHRTFPLTGAHKQADCTVCHQGGVYSGLPNQCVDCHLDNYLATTDPDHQVGGFSQNCESCHSTNAWRPAGFDHTGVTSGCVDCHLDNYQATTNPDHAVAGFPQTCETCHSTNSWFGATFDHRFPINSGNHKNLDCIECHLNPGNFADFSCIDCHEHRQSKVDGEHNGVSGYVWSTAGCYQCHPDGRE